MAIAIWVLFQPAFGLVEGIGLVIAVFLILNGLSARCYLWKAIGINTRDDVCQTGPKEVA